MDIHSVFTTKEAAEKLGITQTRVAQLVKAGIAKNVSPWPLSIILIDKKGLARLAARSTQVGRKKKGKTK